jgi:hypothetical protein
LCLCLVISSNIKSLIVSIKILFLAYIGSSTWICGEADAAETTQCIMKRLMKIEVYKLCSSIGRGRVQKDSLVSYNLCIVLFLCNVSAACYRNVWSLFFQTHLNILYIYIYIYINLYIYVNLYILNTYNYIYIYMYVL